MQNKDFPCLPVHGRVKLSHSRLIISQGMTPDTEGSVRLVIVNAFLEDLRVGVDNACLMEKHHLTVSGLWKTFDMLESAGMLEPAELKARRPQRRKIRE